MNLTQLHPSWAAGLLAGIERHDPRGVMRAQDVAELCHRGLCFAAMQDGQAAGVYVLHVKAGQAWIQAASGQGDAMRALLPAIEQQVSDDCDSIGFQTARRGLVRKAEAMGYRVTGWMLRKELRPWIC